MGPSMLTLEGSLQEGDNSAQTRHGHSRGGGFKIEKFVLENGYLISCFPWSQHYQRHLAPGSYPLQNVLVYRKLIS